MAMTPRQYQKAICEAWFASSAGFAAQALTSPVDFPDRFRDSIGARGILLVNAFGLVRNLGRCAKCKSALELRSYSRKDCNSNRFEFCCACTHPCTRFEGLVDLKLISWLRPSLFLFPSSPSFVPCRIKLSASVESNDIT